MAADRTTHLQTQSTWLIFTVSFTDISVILLLVKSKLNIIVVLQYFLLLGQLWIYYEIRQVLGQFFCDMKVGF